ncbi:hypothetical protein BKA69DRAFT_1038521 [Paraphysoderma sedebokerense]|nr:hypothetical protein BKA69DRAFT_1038521 [Paraphysoderma sedebokerense]
MNKSNSVLQIPESTPIFDVIPIDDQCRMASLPNAADQCLHRTNQRRDAQISALGSLLNDIDSSKSPSIDYNSLFSRLQANKLVAIPSIRDVASTEAESICSKTELHSEHQNNPRIKAEYTLTKSRGQEKKIANKTGLFGDLSELQTNDDTGACFYGIESPETHLVATPECIMFENYKVGSTYSDILTITNCSKHSVPIRLSPYSSVLNSKNFSVQPIGPEASNFLAPGMSIKFTISFKPTCTSDYHEEVLILDGTNSITVSITAHRLPPIISLPRILICRAARPGKVEILNVTIQNIGGAGHFKIIPETRGNQIGEGDYIEYESNGKSYVESSIFRITPSEFSIPAWGRMTLSVEYTLSKVSSWDMCLSKFKLVSDNGGILDFIAVGMIESPLITLTSNEVELQNSGKMRFVDQDFGSEAKKRISIRNNTLLQLKFKWILSGSAFSVKPNEGDLGPHEEAVGNIVFHPHQIGVHEARIQLLITSDGWADQVHSLSIYGVCVPPHISIDSPYLSLPENCRLNSPITSQFALINRSLSNISYTFYTNLSPKTATICIIADGILEAGGDGNIAVTLTPHYPGDLMGSIFVLVRELKIIAEIPILSFVAADGRSLKIESFLNFGVTRLGLNQFKNFISSSAEMLDIQFTLSVSNKGYAPMRQIFHLRHSKLNRMLKCQVNGDLSMISIRDQQFSGYLQLVYRNYSVMVSEYFGVTQKPVLFPLHCQVSFHGYAANQEVTQNILIFNPTNSDLRFACSKDIRDLCQVKYKPTCGVISAKGIVEIEVAATSKAVDDIEIFGAITLLETGKHIGYQLIIHGHKPSIEIGLEHNDRVIWHPVSKPQNLHINLGKCALNVAVSSCIYINNQSSHDIDYRCRIRRYSILSETHRRTADDVLFNSQGKSLVTKGFKSQKNKNTQFQDLQRRFQSNGQIKLGIEISVKPESGTLRPAESKKIEIRACGNFPGVYSDVLQCQVENATLEVPLAVILSGNPVKLSGPTVNYMGSYYKMELQYHQWLDIENTLPRTVEVEWISTKQSDANKFTWNPSPIIIPPFSTRKFSLLFPVNKFLAINGELIGKVKLVEDGKLGSDKLGNGDNSILFIDDLKLSYVRAIPSNDN